MVEGVEKIFSPAKRARRLYYFRWLLLAGGLAYLLFGWMYQAYLPGSLPMSMPHRIGVSLFLFGILAFTYLSRWAKENAEIVVYFAAAGAVSHLLYFAFVNNYELNYALSVIVVLIAINFLMPGNRNLRWFNLAYNAGVVVSVLLSSNPAFNQAVYLASVLSISALSYLLSWSQQRARDEYEHLFRESPVGLLRADSKGNVKEFNDEMLQIMDNPGEREFSEENIFDRLDICPKSQESIVNEEKHVTLPSGKEVWVNCSVSSLSGRAGEPSDVIIGCQDISERKEAEGRIQYMTFHDGLTELYNRTFYNKVIEGIDRVEHYPFSVLFIDVDKLKLINDGFGHKTGDEFLVETAQLIKNTCRKEDLVFRWGGDEIVILLPNTGAEEREKVSARLDGERTELEPIDIPLSIGGATWERYREGQDLDDLLQEAEDKMYKRKREKQEEVSREILNKIIDHLREKSGYVLEHSRRVEQLSLQLGEKLELKTGELEKLGRAAKYHDIGKVAEDEETLFQFFDGEAEKEREKLKTHCNVGYQIAKQLQELSGVARTILHHHEWWDGRGYPTGASKEEIPYNSRIISVANVYDAMVSHPSQEEERVSQEKALDKIEEMSGSRFDPAIVKQFLETIKLDFPE